MGKTRFVGTSWMWLVMGIGILMLLVFGAFQEAGHVGKLAELTSTAPDVEIVIFERPEFRSKILPVGNHSLPLSGEHYNTRLP